MITTWIESAAFLLKAPSYVVSQDIQRTSYYMFELVVTGMGVTPLEILTTARVLMVLFLSAVLLACFYYAVRLFGLVPALVGFLLLAFDPFITALTRTSHLDAPQAVLMLLSLLSLSSYLFVKTRWPDLVLSGAAGGMALLAKLPGLFILPVVGLLVLVPLWRIYRREGRLDRSEIGNAAKIVGIWSVVFAAAFVLLWPAMWVAPGNTLAEFFGQVGRYSSTAVQTIGVSDNNLFSELPGSDILDVVEPGYTPAYFFRYLLIFLWRSTPIVLLGLVWFAVFSFWKLKESKLWNPRLAGAWLFILIYTLGMTLPWKSSDKYFAPVFVLACLIAGLGWYLAGAVLSDKTGRKNARYWLMAVALGFQLGISIYHYPYYFTYYNPLMGGGQRASEKLIVGVGEGLDIAARTLDELPGSEEFRVMSLYGIGPFSYFFDGQAYPIYSTDESVWTEGFVKTLQRMDFLVIYTNQRLRHGPERLFELTDAVVPDYTITLRGIDYAWIYWVPHLPFDNELERLSAPDSGDPP